MNIDENTKLVISLASKQSGLGAAMHNAGYEHLKANYIYLPRAVDDIELAVAGIRGLKVIGSAVSMPYKQSVMQYLDDIDDIAKEIGAVNTISNKDGVLTGYNSDWIGVVRALEEATELKGKKAVVLGAGGAARAAIYGLKSSGTEVTVLNRNQEHGRSISLDFDVRYEGKLERLSEIKDYDILVNTTSVGFQAKESPVTAEKIKKGIVVLDAVAIPLQTEFIKLAATRECIIIPGYRMLIHQALFQFELFVGKAISFEVLQNALLEIHGE